MRSFEMFGLDTFESIHLSDARGEMPLELRPGPKVWHCDFGGDSDKLLYLYPEHLSLLYERFRAANPKGIVFGPEGSFDDYAPSDLSREELEKLREERKIFVSLFLTDEDLGYPHARKYLPELFEPGMIDKMVADPWLNVRLLGKAEKEGAVPSASGDAARWSPEWRAYCDRLIASGEYK
jgi:hypothetical protein